MTLNSAIREVTLHGKDIPYIDTEIMHGELSARLSLAIATILNAVVKGELK